MTIMTVLSGGLSTVAIISPSDLLGI